MRRVRRPWVGADAAGLGGGCAQRTINQLHDSADFQVRACKYERVGLEIWFFAQPRDDCKAAAGKRWLPRA